MKKLITALLVLLLFGVAAGSALYVSITSSLPQIISVEDYKPLLVSDVYARGGEKIGDYSRQIRTLIPYEQIPQQLVYAFLAIEDRQFFEHGGINYLAILRAMLTNLTSGRTKQGASTITQQLAKQLFLSPERTYTRKLREAILAKRLEENLRKEDILYLYLNQIYFGSGAHGVAAAADIYFRKTLDQLTIGEMAIIAGLPQRPSEYSPIENPKLAKGRQREVLNAMVAIGRLTQEEADKAFNDPVTVYLSRDYKSVAAFAVETIRQMLVAHPDVGETKLLDEGLKIYTTIDFKKQLAAQEQVREGLRAVDKRQGYRGALRNIADAEEQQKFLADLRLKLIEEKSPIRVITPEGLVAEEKPFEVFHERNAKGQIVKNLPDYLPIGKIADGLVRAIDDELGLVTVQIAEAEALLDLGDMDWARKPDPSVNALLAPKLTKPSQALKVGDVISVRVMGEFFETPRTKDFDQAVADNKKKNPQYAPPDFNAFAKVSLEQEPVVQGALIAFENTSGDTLAMVGGYEFKKNKNEFNRALQAKRQTGSSFKSIVYAAALDKGFSPATPVQDAPLVFETDTESEGQEGETKKWKPNNHGEKFAGDTLFRTALVRSLNIPTVRILEKIGVQWVIDYARRFGIFSALNPDLSLGLGSSSLTLYEMTRTFAQFSRLGKRLRPVIVRKVVDREGNTLVSDLTLDAVFEKDLKPIEEEYEAKRLAYLESLSGTSLSEKGDASARSEQDQAAQGQNGEVGSSSQNASNGSDSAGADASGQANDQLIDPSQRKVPLVYFENPEQIMTPQTAYLATSLLSATITDPQGTAGSARALGRPAAGKTGSSNGYVDGWFVGYTPQISTGVWVGFDEEKSIGAGEVGGRNALPIWLEFMKDAHEEIPATPFAVPSGIVFANIDSQTGKLASAQSSRVVSQAFLQGTEPSLNTQAPTREEEADLLKEDLSE